MAQSLGLRETGSLILRNASLRDFDKDWETAGDLSLREQRLAAKRAKRRATWSLAEAGVPVVRGPLFEAVSCKGESLAWHRRRAQAVFKRMDKKCIGEVSLSQLKASFQEMRIPIDCNTFTEYMERQLPAGVDCVTAGQFLQFHEAVWTNQTPAARCFSGDPHTGGDAAGGVGPCSMMRPSGVSEQHAQPLHGPTAGAPAGLRHSRSAPSYATISELQANEHLLRKAFSRHANGERHLRRRDVPLILKDLGLDFELGRPASTRAEPAAASASSDKQVDAADGGADGKISFHEFVDYQNRFINNMEHSRKPAGAAQ